MEVVSVTQQKAGGGKKTQMCIMDFWTQREGEGGMIWDKKKRKKKEKK